MRRMYRLVGLLLSVMVALTVVGSIPAQAQSATPFGLAGRAVVSPDGVAYTIYSGETPSFDGLPLAVDVTVPAGAQTPLPLVVMFHDWGQHRGYWQSATAANSDPVIDRWNNVAFAARGYAVLNYTIRGWHDSCGPKDAAVPTEPATLPTACSSREYWIHLADPRYEIHDAQHLIGTLVDNRIADPARIGVTGQSYGGGHSWLIALLNNRTVNLDSSIRPWTSPNGVPLKIAAAIPQFTWSSLTNALLPNGRATDAGAGSTDVLNNPVGVPIQSYLTGLYASGPALQQGFYSPPGSDPSADLMTWYSRFTAGNPYFNDATLDPITQRAMQELDRRSPLFVTPNANVPIYQIQGFTDPLFPPVQAVQMRNHVLAWDPKYPIKSFFGDVGHSNANNPADQWNVAHAAGHAFFDHYLRGRGAKPSFDVTAMTTTCVAGQQRQTFTAPSWAQLKTRTLELVSTQPQVTTTASAGPAGPATDPIANGGCLATPTISGTGVAAWSFPVTQGYTLVGQPTLNVQFASTATDTPLHVRLWDVAPDGLTQTLVSRGVYRHQGTVGSAAQVSFQIMANSWEFQSGHTLRLEIVGNDSPYYQASNLPAEITITAVRLSLPVR